MRIFTKVIGSITLFTKVWKVPTKKFFIPFLNIAFAMIPDNTVK